MQTLVEIRQNGHRIGPSQQLVGVTEISVPIRSAHAQVIAVLTCPYLPHAGAPGDGKTTKTVEQSLDLLIRAADQASTT